jgi:acetyl esterase
MKSNNPGITMSLDPQVKAFIDTLNATPPPPLAQFTVEMARQGMAAMFGTKGEPRPVGATNDFTIPDEDGCPMRARSYRPFESIGLLPVLLFIHGGGWVAGDLDSYDALCRELTETSGCLLIAFEYRLAPEHKFPAAPLDCYAALRWVATNASELGGAGDRIAIGGDSAGGNLSAVVAQMARDRGGPAIMFQLLVYPATDHACDTPSYRDNGKDYLLTTEGMHWNYAHYLSDTRSGSDPLVSPLRATDFSAFPPALIITAEFDPLRDEGEVYAERLRDAGVAATVKRYDGMIHAFFSLGDYFDQGRQAVHDAGAALRRVFNLPERAR